LIKKYYFIYKYLSFSAKKCKWNTIRRTN